MKFEIHSYGDPSVGLWGVDASVEFHDNLEWNDDAIEQARSMLMEFYDVKISDVFTEEEYAKLAGEGDYGG